MKVKLEGGYVARMVGALELYDDPEGNRHLLASPFQSEFLLNISPRYHVLNSEVSKQSSHSQSHNMLVI